MTVYFIHVYYFLYYSLQIRLHFEDAKKINLSNASKYSECLVYHCSFIHPCKASTQDSSDNSRAEHDLLSLECCNCMRIKERSSSGSGKRSVLLPWMRSRSASWSAAVDQVDKPAVALKRSSMKLCVASA